jgi:hypothetical protein
MSSKTEGLMINPEEVKKVFLSCLYKPEEIGNTKKIPKDAVIVEGIRGKYAFHPKRLEEQRSKVTEWLKALPHQFRKNGGGGWSFLNACMQENGVQWTGLHERMEQLFCMAIGLGLAKCQMPREMWFVFPGGMPYYVIFVE